MMRVLPRGPSGPGLARRAGRAAVRGAALLSLLACLAIPLASAADPAGASPQRPHVRPIPVLAYFYIWYNPSSWNRAKIDYPLIGRYSSGDAAVMAEQISLAKRSGITGFLVSWKNTPVLDYRLALLRRLAAAAHFKLGIVFEGRDFHGRPLPLDQVSSGFSYLAAHYAHDPVFNIFGKPLVAWSGTWQFPRAQLLAITRAFGSRLLVLATQKQPAAYDSIARMFRGDAYYWSSADPLHTPGYREKLAAFSAAVHRRHGLWIAPAAPGFDARLIHGRRVIPRRGGQTLRVAMNAALDSSPDAIGIISWNEYSENSQVEPSRRYGTMAINVIASIEHARPPAMTVFDSSGPAGFQPGIGRFLVIAALVVLIAGGLIFIVRRRG